MAPGKYRAMEWSEPQQKYVENSELGIVVEVQVRHCPSTLSACSRSIFCRRNLQATLS